MFDRIAIALAFSPRITKLFNEAVRAQKLFQADLIIIHIGSYTEDDKKLLQENIEKSGIDQNRLKVIWENGVPAKKILSVCKKEKVGLLIAGALKKEDLFTYYMGSIARRILRKADCSVLMITQPSLQAKPFKRIVIYAENTSYVEGTIKLGIDLAKKQQAQQIHIVREIKMYGLAMSIRGEMTEEEVSEARKNLVQEEIELVQNILKPIDTDALKINIKVMSGKSGYELNKFCNRVNADVLIAGTPYKKLGILDRFFQHDLEYILADLPCDLLIYQPKDG